MTPAGTGKSQSTLINKGPVINNREGRGLQNGEADKASFTSKGMLVEGGGAKKS